MKREEGEGKPPSMAEGLANAGMVDTRPLRRIEESAPQALLEDVMIISGCWHELAMMSEVPSIIRDLSAGTLHGESFLQCDLRPNLLIMYIDRLTNLRGAM